MNLKMFYSFLPLTWRSTVEHMDFYIWAMVNTHYMVDGHPIHNKDPKIMVIINPYEPLDD